MILLVVTNHFNSRHGCTLKQRQLQLFCHDCLQRIVRKATGVVGRGFWKLAIATRLVVLTNTEYCVVTNNEFRF